MIHIKDMINIKDIDGSLLKLDKYHTKVLVFITLDVLHILKN